MLNFAIMRPLMPRLSDQQGKVVMIEVKKLCVYGVAALSLGAPLDAALAQCGTASWYHEGSRTANGERYRTARYLSAPEYRFAISAQVVP